MPAIEIEIDAVVVDADALAHQVALRGGNPQASLSALIAASVWDPAPDAALGEVRVSVRPQGAAGFTLGFACHVEDPGKLAENASAAYSARTGVSWRPETLAAAVFEIGVVSSYRASARAGFSIQGWRVISDAPTPDVLSEEAAYAMAAP